MKHNDRNGTPEVTIIVPVYNKEQYIAECVDSIIAQTHTAWRLLLIDDGSTDGSGKMCDEYAASDPRIMVCHVPNGGVSKARNHGIDKAAGDYITFVDADDVLEPEFAARLLEKAQCGHHDVVIAGYTIIGEGACGEPYRFTAETFENGGYKRLLSYEHWGYTWGKMYRTRFLKDNGLLFPEGVGYGEDGIFFENVLSCKPRVYADDSALYRYRVFRARPGSGKPLDYEVEMHTLRHVISAAEGLSEALGDKGVYRLLSVYPHIWRVVLAVYATPGLTRRQRIRLLLAMPYTPEQAHFRGTGRNERMLADLVVHRHFAIFDFLYSIILRR